MNECNLQSGVGMSISRRCLQSLLAWHFATKVVLPVVCKRQMCCLCMALPAAQELDIAIAVHVYCRQ